MADKPLQPLSGDSHLSNRANPYCLKRNSNGAAKGSVKAIEFKKSLRVVTITSTRRLSSFVFLQKVFELFGQQAIAFHLVTVSEIAVSLVLDESENLGALQSGLCGIARMKVESGKATVCLRLAETAATNDLPGRIFQAVKDVNLSFITHGDAGRRLAFVIDESEMEVVAFILFELFFEKSAAATGN